MMMNYMINTHPWQNHMKILKIKLKFKTKSIKMKSLYCRLVYHNCSLRLSPYWIILIHILSYCSDHFIMNVFCIIIYKITCTTLYYLPSLTSYSQQHTANWKKIVIIVYLINYLSHYNMHHFSRLILLSAFQQSSQISSPTGVELKRSLGISDILQVIT